jgi:hypothetical protein
VARTAKVAGATALCAFAAAWIVYGRIYEHGGARKIAFADLTARLHAPEFPHPAGRVFHSRDQLAAFLRGAMPGRRPHAPQIDFRRREAILVAAGPRSSTGYSLRVLGVTSERGRIVVTVRERTPRLGDPVRARVTYPYRLITLPTSPKPVYLDWQGRP